MTATPIFCMIYLDFQLIPSGDIEMEHSTEMSSKCHLKPSVIFIPIDYLLYKVGQKC